MTGGAARGPAGRRSWPASRSAGTPPADEVAGGGGVPGRRRRGLHHRGRHPGRRRPGHGALTAQAAAERKERHGHPGRQADPGHRRAHRRLHRLPRGAGWPRRRARRSCSPASGGCSLVRADRQAAARRRRRCSSSTSPTPSQLGVAGRPGRPSTSDGLDGVVHAIGVRPAERASGGNFLNTPVGGRGHRPARLGLLAQGAGGGRAAADEGTAAVDRRPRLRRQPWRGRPTTGWAWPRRRSSRPPATWPATSGQRGIRVNLVAAGPLRTMAAKSIPGFEQFEERVGRPGPARLGLSDPEPAARGVRGAAVRLVPGHDRRDRPRRRRLPRDRRVMLPTTTSRGETGVFDESSPDIDSNS